jgi:hypothetical protein
MIASNPIHKTHDGLDLGGFNILFPMIHFVIGNKGYIKVTKSFGTFERKS